MSCSEGNDKAALRLFYHQLTVGVGVAVHVAFKTRTTTVSVSVLYDE